MPARPSGLVPWKGVQGALDSRFPPGSWCVGARGGRDLRIPNSELGKAWAAGAEDRIQERNRAQRVWSFPRSQAGGPVSDGGCGDSPNLWDQMAGGGGCLTEISDTEMSFLCTRARCL